ncbi:unnamed protein product, partial [Callosobruchus maculatus]
MRRSTSAKTLGFKDRIHLEKQNGIIACLRIRNKDIPSEDTPTASSRTRGMSFCYGMLSFHQRRPTPVPITIMRTS